MLPFVCFSYQKIQSLSWVVFRCVRVEKVNEWMSKSGRLSDEQIIIYGLPMLSHGKRAFYRKIFHFNDVELKMSLRPQKTSKFNNQKFTKFNYRNRKIQPKFSNFFLNFDNLKMRRQMKIERDWECVTYILTTNWEATQILIKVSQMFTQNIDFIIKKICFALHFRSMSLNDVFLISIFSLIHRITVCFFGGGR